MKLTTTDLFVSFLVVQRAAATYDWGTAKRFSNPSNTDNDCTADQKAGFNWDDLKAGQFDSYKGFDFSGFDCAAPNGTLETRSIKRRTGSNGKFIKGNIKKGSGPAPKFSCSDDKGFSIIDMQVATSAETDVEFIYDMPDGSSCKHTHSCSKDSNNVSNNQCGGAVAVSFNIPDYGSEEDCDIEIDHVGFDCEPAVTPITSETASATSTSSAEVTPTISSSSEAIAESSSSVSSEASSGTEVSPVTASSESSAAVSVTESESVPTITESSSSSETSITLTTSTIFSTFTSTILACSSDVPDCPANSISIVTLSTAISTTICPVSSEIPTAVETPAASSEVPTAVETSAAPSEASESSIPTETLEVSPSSESSSTEIASTVDETGAATSAAASVTEPATSQIITTELVLTTTTICPVTITSVSDSVTIIATSSTLSTTVITSVVTLCTACIEAPPTTLSSVVATVTPSSAETVDPVGVPETSSEVVTASESSSPEPSEVAEPSSEPEPQPSDAPCPPVLPSCLNTWLSLVPKCTSNSDASCFCPSKEFTDAVISCVQAWGSSADELSAALSYFTGICANNVAENPAIITAIPTTITLCPTIPPAAPSSPATVAQSSVVPGITEIPFPETSSFDEPAPSAPPAPPAPVPSTVISYTQTVTVVDTTSIVTNVITVPQVSFVTNTPATPVAPATGTETGIAPQPAPVSVGLVPVGPGPDTALPSVSTATFVTSSALVNGTGQTATGSGPIAVFTGAAAKVRGYGVAGLSAFAIGSIVLLI